MTGFAYNPLTKLLKYPHFCLLQRLYSSSFNQLSVVKPGQLFLTVDPGLKGTINISPASLSKDLTSYAFRIAYNGNEHFGVSFSMKEVNDRNNVFVTLPDGVNSDSTDGIWDIAIPHHYAIAVDASDDIGIRLSSLEPDSISLKLKDGSCELVNIKTTDCKLEGQHINVVMSKAFIGNVSASIANGSLLAEKVQGKDVFLSASSGNIHISSLYATSSCCKCNHGDITIGNAHGNLSLQTHKGDITIKSLEGSIQAFSTEGNITAHLTDHTTALLNTKYGEAIVSLPEKSSSSLTILSDDVVIDDSLVFDQEKASDNGIHGHIGESDQQTNRRIEISARQVRLEAMDWLKAQKLNFCSDLD